MGRRRGRARGASSTAGEDFGLRQVGGRAYSSNTLESGWIPSPLPAVYSGESLKPYREWLPANGLRGLGVDRRQLLLGRASRTTTSRRGTSATGSYVKFDHDFIGRDALEQMAERRAPPEGDAGARRRGRDAHDRHDVPEDRPREVHRLAVGGLLDASVRPGDGRRRDGRRLHLGRLQRERGQDAHAGGRRRRVRGAGHRGDFVWGEEDGGSAKPTVERHVQTEIRAVVSPVPYVEAVRTSYAARRLARGACLTTRVPGQRTARSSTRDCIGAER